MICKQLSREFKQVKITKLAEDAKLEKQVWIFPNNPPFAFPRAQNVSLEQAEGLRTSLPRDWCGC